MRAPIKRLAGALCAGGAICAGAAVIIVVGCTASQLQSPLGQLFCAITDSQGATFTAGIVEAAVTGAVPGLAPIAVIATNALASDVQADCAAAAKSTGAKGGVPVSPPPNPAAAPTVAIVVPPKTTNN